LYRGYPEHNSASKGDDTMAEADDIARIIKAINNLSVKNQELLNQILESLEEIHAILRDIERNSRT
jgi:hypothetical protein